jgi:cytochrome c553
MRHRRSGAHGVVIAMLWMALLPGLQPVARAESRVPEIIHRALTTMPDLRRGASTYAAHCKSCHGPAARGSEEKAIPALAGQHASYLVAQLAAFVEFERDDSGVHRFLAGGGLSQPEILGDVGAYLERLPPRKSGGRAPRQSYAGLLARGKALHVTICASCHQLDAAGDGEHFVPALNGQNPSYLLAQMRRIPHGHRVAAPDVLLQELERMTSSDMEALALYLARLPPGRERAGTAE